jgi:hypothetical protein
MPPPDRAPDTEDPPAARDSVESLVEEFFELRRRGETPDAEAFARRAPGRDVEFLELVAALDVLERAAATVGRTPLEVSGRLGRFRLVRLVGRGGMGSVYEAIDEDVADERARHVALKVLPLHASLDGREVDRFRREAQAVARLVHPHIVPVLGFGEHQGSHWLAMPFVPGRSLDRVLREPGESGDGAAPLLDIDLRAGSLFDPTTDCIFHRLVCFGTRELGPSRRCDEEYRNTEQ